MKNKKKMPKKKKEQKAIEFFLSIQLFEVF